MSQLAVRRAETMSSAAALENEDSHPYIKSISLQNFMCHENFEMHLNKRLNLIYGTNGSGKSTILTAIMIALGSRAQSTSRSESLGSFVLTGASKAWISVKFHVPWAYSELHERYGNEVTVRRSITTKGTSSYDIIDEKGSKVPNAGLKDAKQICYYFGIYPDNELAMLSQEKAKEFLVHATARAKYEKLQRALLQNVIAQDQAAVESLYYSHQQQLNVMRDREEAVQQTRERALEILNRANEQARRQRRLEMINNTLAWRDHDLFVKERDEIQAKLLQAEEELAGLVERDDDRERSSLMVSELENLREDQNSLSERIEGLSQEILDIEKEQQERLFTIKRTQEDIDASREKKTAHQREIVELHERAAANGPEKLEIRLRDLRAKKNDAVSRREEAIDSVENIEQMMGRLRQGEEDVSKAIKDLESEKERITRKENDLNAELRQIRTGNVSSSNQSRKNPQHAKHKELQSLVAQRMSWKEPPLGPLYEFLELKDEGAGYSPALEKLWNSILESWWVQTDSDRSMLRKLAASVGLNSIQIILRKDDPFNFNSFLPPVADYYKRILDLLVIESDAIKRILVDLGHVESMVLVSGTETAFKVVQEVSKIKSALALTTSNSGRTQFTQVSSTSARLDSAKIQTNDVVRIKIGMKARLDQIQAELRALEEQRTELSLQLSSEHDKKKKLDEEVAECLRKLSKRNNVIRKATEDILEISGEINQAELSVGTNDYKGEIEQLQADIAKLDSEIGESTSALAGFESELAELQSVHSATRETRTALMSQVHDIKKRAEEIRAAQHRQEHARLSQRKLIGRKQQLVTELQATLRVHETQVEESHERIEAEFGAREDANESDLSKERADIYSKSDFDLKRERDFLLARGQAPAASDQEVAQARQDSENAEHSLSEINRNKMEMQEHAATIGSRLKAREENEKRAWEDIKARIAAEFTRTLKHRNFSGDVVIDDDRKQLNIEALPEGSTNTKVTTLSGGEKSFTQVALLMAVWGTMQVGLVAMDEYDVFMDKANRSVSLHLLGETITSHNMQCLLITPQDVDTSVLRGVDFKMHKLRPARN